MKHLSLFISLTVSFALFAKDGANEKPILCQGNYHSEADAVAQLQRVAATHSNLTEWKARAAAVRKQILLGS